MPDRTGESISPRDVSGLPWWVSEVAEIRDERGAVVVLPEGASVPHGFDAKRVYFLYTDLPSAQRGNHAHTRLHQVIVCLTGSVTVELDNGRVTETVRLESPNIALTVGPLVWRRLHTFDPGTICAVLASEPYDPEDYLHTYEDFIKHLDDHVARSGGAAS
ncbi:dTDP-6-deoxy-3,4-keto-hexulose isomerase [Nesterenkonia sp. AN1]|nr:dTDP-6-deoxy-3,4-keto-hexulose isomerase [Nesterenkonia sp. AN1]